MPPDRDVFLEATLSWLKSHLHFFWLPSDARTKRLSEFLILSSRLVETARHADLARDWLQAAGQCLDESEDYWRCRVAPTQSLHFLAPYLMLRRSGFRSAEYESTLDWLVDAVPWASTEVLPYHRLQNEWLLWQSGVWAEPDWSVLYGASGLARTVNPLHAGKWDVYYATHTLFYLSDFGRRAPAVDDLPRIADILCLWLVRYVRDQHWDLVGELLLCADLISATNDIVETVSRLLMSSQAPDGSVVPDRVARDCLRTAADSDDARLRFENCYHSTLVGSLWALG